MSASDVNRLLLEMEDEEQLRLEMEAAQHEERLRKAAIESLRPAAKFRLSSVVILSLSNDFDLLSKRLRVNFSSNPQCMDRSVLAVNRIRSTKGYTHGARNLSDGSPVYVAGAVNTFSRAFDAYDFYACNPFHRELWQRTNWFDAVESEDDCGKIWFFPEVGLAVSSDKFACELFFSALSEFQI